MGVEGKLGTISLSSLFSEEETEVSKRLIKDSVSCCHELGHGRIFTSETVLQKVLKVQ